MMADKDPVAENVHVVWRVTDGRPGHENQSAGLLQALGQLTPLHVVDISPIPFIRALLTVLFKIPFKAGHPAPDMVVGAGHATHWSILAVARYYSIPSVVLMKPGLPMSWFGVCIVPEHDQVTASDRCIPTKGALNRIIPGHSHSPGEGLMLIGGPSRHYQWNNRKVIEQIQAIVSAESDIHWTLTTSRRTPPTFIPELQSRVGNAVTIVPVEETDQNWVANALSVSSRVWISEDSVSMVYEALTSGAACGLLELSSSQTGKIQRGIRSLEANGLIKGFRRWSAGSKLTPPTTIFNEAKRCASLVYKKWMKKS